MDEFVLAGKDKIVAGQLTTDDKELRLRCYDNLKKYLS